MAIPTLLKLIQRYVRESESPSAAIAALETVVPQECIVIVRDCGSIKLLDGQGALLLQHPVIRADDHLTPSEHRPFGCIDQAGYYLSVVPNRIIKLDHMSAIRLLNAMHANATLTPLLQALLAEIRSNPALQTIKERLEAVDTAPVSTQRAYRPRGDGGS